MIKVPLAGVRAGPEMKDERNDGSSTSSIQEALASVLTIPNHCTDEHRDSAEEPLDEAACRKGADG